MRTTICTSMKDYKLPKFRVTGELKVSSYSVSDNELPNPNTILIIGNDNSGYSRVVIGKNVKVEAIDYDKD